MSFSGRYIQNLIIFKFVSLIVMGFLISLLFFEIRANVYDIIYLQNEVDDSTIQSSKFGLGFQSIITTFFLIRFILLYFNKPTYVWLSQFFWLLSWISLFMYHVASESYFGNSWGGEHIGSLFVGILSVTNRWLFAYMMLSPIKQISTLIFSYFHKE